MLHSSSPTAPNPSQNQISVSVVPPTAIVQASGQQQFKATVQNSSNSSVNWSVDGVAGGNASVGTVSSTGLYIAPAAASNHTVTATSTADTTKSGNAIVTITALPPPPTGFAVLTRDFDNSRSGANTQETVLTPANVNAQQFGKLISYDIDGYAYAQPLYVPNLNIAGGLHNVVFEATENDQVYAFDADGKQTTALWHTDFTDPASGITAIPCGDLGACSIASNIGISATPVISLERNAIYVVARTKESGKYIQKIHALDLSTGAEKFGGPVVIQATFPGTGDSSQNGVVSFDPFFENNRASLLMVGNNVYVGFASINDAPPYHGWLLGYSADTLQLVQTFCSTPNATKGGYWHSSGPAADANGNIFAIGGNGTPIPDDANYGDGFMKLSTANNLAVADYFIPFNSAQLNLTDVDVGSGGPLLLPDQPGAHPHLVVGAGKEGKIYVVDRDNMGRFQSGSDNIVQSIPGAIGSPSDDEKNFNTPAYWNGRVYFQGVDDVMKAFAVQNGMLTTVPVMQSKTVFTFPGARPIISANGLQNGIAWVEEWPTSTHNGVLHAYDANNLGNELYNSNQNAARDAVGPATRLTAPTVANGKVYVGATGHLLIYGLLPH